MKGVLVVNHFLKGNKFDTLHAHLLKSAENCGIQLELFTNSELAVKTPKAEFVLFWDKDINLAKRLENSGLPVFNSAKSIALCDDKAKTYLALDGVVAQPKTLIAPMSYFKADFSEFIDEAVSVLGLPLVFKECFGSFGEQVFLCSSKENIKKHITEKPFLLQKYIENSSGRDKRLEVVGSKVVAATRRINENDFRSNVTNGGTMTPCEANEQECETAINACKALGLTFGGVDILDGNILCEVNSNAHIINIMNATGTDIAPLIFEEIGKRI